MINRPFSLLFLAVMSMLQPLACATEVQKRPLLEFGRYSLNWLPGWEDASSEGITRFQGPGPTGITIDVTGEAKTTAKEQKDSISDLRGYALHELVALVRRHGDIQIEPKFEDGPSGTTVFSASSFDSKKDYFSEIILVIFPDGSGIQMAIEGVGARTKEEQAQYVKLAMGIHLKQEPNKSQSRPDDNSSSR